MNSYERNKYEQELRESRMKEQRERLDYSYLDGEIEKCECGCPINSHGHCPRCDY